MNMKKTITVLLMLYVLALHSSIAGMEMLSWSLFGVVLFDKLKNKPRSFNFPLFWPLLGLLAASALSLLLNPELKPFWFQFGFMRWEILFWMFTWVLSDLWSAEFEKLLIKVWSIALVITAAYTIFQFFAGIDLFRTDVESLDHQTGGFYRTTGFFSMSLTFGYVVGVSYFSILFPALNQYKERWKTWAILLSGPIMMVSCGARGAWMGAFLAGLVYFASARRRLLPYFSGLAVVAIVALSFLNSKLNDLLHFHLEKSSDIRIHLWRSYWAMFKDHPWFGVGLFQADKLLPQYYDRLGIVEEFTSHAHNVPLQWLGGAGIFAFLFYAYLSFYFIYASYRLTRTSAWGWSLLMAQIYWHAGSMTEANFFDGEVNHIIVFTWALVVVLRGRQEALEALDRA